MNVDILINGPMKQEYCQQGKAQNIRKKLKNEKEKKDNHKYKGDFTKNKYGLRGLEFITDYKLSKSQYCNTITKMTQKYTEKLYTKQGIHTLY